MLNGQKQKKKKCQKFKISNFTIVWATLAEILHRSMHDFGGVNLRLVCTFRRELMSFESFSPIGSYVNENEKKN